MEALFEVFAVLMFLYLLVGAALMLISKSQGEGWNYQILYKWPWILAGKETY